MSLYSDIVWGRETNLSAPELNRRAKIIADAIEELRAFKPDWQEQVDRLTNVGLERINEALLPAYEQIIDVANLGALFSSTSASTNTISVGVKTFVLPEATRLNFAPTPFLIAVADGDFDLHMIGALSSYNNETGVLVLQVTRVSGAGEFSSWQISPVVTAEDLEVLRAQVAANAATAVQKAAEALAARDEAVPAGAAATAALTTFQGVWYGALADPPEGAAIGSLYFSTVGSEVRVFDGVGWIGLGGGGATGGGPDRVFVENDQVVTTDYTISADKNAMTTGPVTINSGVTVTVEAGARWVII